jgi:hypothetical protein
LAQYELLRTERDELKAHCERLGLEIGESHGREIQLRQDNETLSRARSAMEQERNQLAEDSRKLRQQLMGAGSEHMKRDEYLLQRMQSDWDGRARLNARYYTNNAKVDWDVEEYYYSGEQSVLDYVQNDIQPKIHATSKPCRVVDIDSLETWGASRHTSPRQPLPYFPWSGPAICL